MVLFISGFILSGLLAWLLALATYKSITRREKKNGDLISALVFLVTYGILISATFFLLTISEPFGR